MLQRILESEQEHFKNNAIKFLSTHNTNYFNKGAIIRQIQSNKQSVQNAIDSSFYPATTDITSVDYSKLFEHVTDKIVQININDTYQECIKVIEQYRAKAGKYFYGALLRSPTTTSYIINPYHLVTTLTLLEHNPTTKFNIILYFYTDRDDMDNLYHSNLHDQTITDKNLESILHIYKNKTTNIYETTAVDPQPSGDILVKYRVLKHKDEVTTADTYLVPTQIMTNGIIAPFYASSLVYINHRSSTTGFSISPVRTCNIASTNIQIPRASNVCTGSKSNKTLEGLATLTHANYGSPYVDSKTAFQPGSLPYIDSMIEKSVQLYKLAGIL